MLVKVFLKFNLYCNFRVILRIKKNISCEQRSSGNILLLQVMNYSCKNINLQTRLWRKSIVLRPFTLQNVLSVYRTAKLLYWFSYIYNVRRYIG